MLRCRDNDGRARAPVGVGGGPPSAASTVKGPLEHPAALHDNAAFAQARPPQRGSGKRGRRLPFPVVPPASYPRRAPVAPRGGGIEAPIHDPPAKTCSNPRSSCSTNSLRARSSPAASSITSATPCLPWTHEVPSSRRWFTVYGAMACAGTTVGV